MNILREVQVKPFSRMVWKGQENKNIWADSIAICSQQVQELEIKTVLANLRKCSWRTIREENLPEFSEQMGNIGLIVLPVKYVGVWEGFSHVTQPIKPGQPKMVYCIISSKKEDAFGFRNAFENNEIAAQGHYLGYPRCCSEWFQEQYSNGIPDPIWQAAQNSIHDMDGENKILLDFKMIHPLSNPLLRYEGIRVSFHIPCSFHCKETIEIAEKQLNLINIVHRKILERLLMMNMKWSALHGIGIVETPIFISNFNTIPTAEKYEVKLMNGYIPGE